MTRLALAMAALLCTGAALADPPPGNGQQGNGQQGNGQQQGNLPSPPSTSPPGPSSQASVPALETTVKMCREQHSVSRDDSSIIACPAGPTELCLTARYEFEPAFAGKCRQLEAEWKRRKTAQMEADAKAQADAAVQQKQAQDAQDMRTIDRALQEYAR